MDPQYVEVLLNYAESFFHGGQPFQCRDMLDVLKKHELAKDYLVTVDLALLIVALELGEDKEAAELYQEQAAAVAELAKTRPCWLQTMPDALQRAEKLAAGTQ